MVGKTVSHYRILEKLGGGGMGVVYKAEDTKLGRTVALKVLPPERVADPNRKRRFVQEARAASSLNHPNIITIYDIDEAEGIHFIAMEYVQGKTLDRLTARHGLRLNEALKYAVQMAAALAKAHSAGIVHRDLKPTNVMVTDDGLVKVLDFGLAKLTEPAPTSEAETVATVGPVTEEGTIVGTVGYMSPEQAEGKPVDARSDIFSFGSVLYEMLTGQRAFQGETKASTMAAILREEPKPLSEAAQGLPHEVERLVKRCLRKDREHRFQTMADLKVASEELKQESDSGELASTPTAVATSDRRKVGESSGFPREGRALAYKVLIGGAALVAIAAALALLLRTPPAPKVLGIHQVTHTGREKARRTFTDGARVYFTDWVGGRPTPMATPASGGDAVPIPMPLKDALIGGITQDNSELIVGSPTPDGQHVMVWYVPVLGGSPRRVGDLVVDDGAVTPHGRGLIYAIGPDVYLANADGTGARKLLSAPGGVSLLCYSPNGRQLRFTVYDYKQSRELIWDASPDGSNLHRFLPDWNPGGSECCGRWTPDGRYYVFQATVAGSTNLWALREGGFFGKHSREPTRLTTGPMQNGGIPVFSKHGKTIFFVGTLNSTELSIYDSRLHEFVPYLGGISAEGLSFSKDGQMAAYVRLPEGTLWRMRIDGSDQLQLTFPPMEVYQPRWSPDGKRIAFWDVPADGHSKIYTIPCDGGAPEALTSGEHGEHDPTWSPDGNALMFDYSGNSPDSSVRVLSLNTRRVTELPGSKGIYSPRWSPDGRYVAALTSGDWKLVLFDFKTQRWERLAGSGTGFPNWSKDGRYIYFVKYSTPEGFYRVEIATRKVEMVAGIGNAQTANGVAGYPWRGVTLNGSPLIARRAGTQEIYALDVDFP